MRMRNGVNEMASRPRNRRPSLKIYGSTAYAPAYDGSAVRAPQGEAVPKPKTRPKEQTRTLTRTRVRVREAGEVAPLSVIGFLAVGVFAALLLWSSAQYMELNDRVAVLRSDLSALQEENVQLSAQYEELFDMERIQAAVGDAMVRPAGDQVVYLDLSEPDSVVLYGEEAGGGVLAALEEIADSLAAYFR